MISTTELLQRKGQGDALEAADIEAFIQGVANGRVTDAQLGAFTMAVRHQGMDVAEQAALTLAMRDSGTVLQWEGLDGPVLDKHSTGGVGDWVSLALAPMIAAAGGYVPMISGRGLDHTGGTLDKLESIPGFSVKLEPEDLRTLVRRNGLAMSGQGPHLAPADGRMYAVRDVTSTVDSIPLIVASIMAKKLAEGLDGLVLDVKTGNGATMQHLRDSRELASQLCQTAVSAGTPCRALVTDMDEPLGWTAGNALEVGEAIDFVTGARRKPRMREVVLGLGAELLVLSGLAPDVAQAADRLNELLDSGAVAERFAVMVAAQGGPADLLKRKADYLPTAAVTQPVVAPRAGWVAGLDTRALGMAVVRLGGGRVRGSDTIDPAVGLSDLPTIGAEFEPGQPVCRVHAAREADWQAAEARVLGAITWADEPCHQRPVILDRVG